MLGNKKPRQVFVVDVESLRLSLSSETTMNGRTPNSFKSPIADSSYRKDESIEEIDWGIVGSYIRINEHTFLIVF
jgi:hypothetical protein